MKILFINGSPNKNGNTAGLAETLLADKAFTVTDRILPMTNLILLFQK